MSKEQENKVTVGRWFTEFWGPTCNLGIVDELAAPDMLLQYSLHEPRRGHEDIKAFMADFREAFRTLSSGAPQTSLPKAIMWSVAGREAVHTPAPLLPTSWLDLYQQQQVARCTSQAPQYYGSRTARLRKRLVLMMESLHFSNSALSVRSNPEGGPLPR